MASVSIDKLDQLSLLILFAINATNGKALNETHLQKIMFQTMKVLKTNPDNVGYRAHYFGPYSDMIKESKDSLESLGYITEKNGKIVISDLVKEKVTEIKPPTEEIGFKIKTVAKYLSELKHDELLLMIYCDDLDINDGRYLENSQIKNEIMNNRVPIAIGMYRSGKISIGRAAELAGTDIREFQNELTKRFGAVYVN
jgi:uncharacterized protein YwgA